MSFKDHDLENNHNDLLHDTYRYKMMVVDDSSMARKLIKKYAKEINANIICEASNAKEAYDKYVEFEPDVVTMDISMPGETGLQAVKNIMRFDPGAKILMVTSHGEESMVLDALESGAKGFILKPVTKEKLEEQFNKVKHDPYKMFKSVKYFQDLKAENLKELVKFSTRSDYFVLLAENSIELFPILRDMAFDCVGGVVPEIIYGGQVYHEGFLIFELSKEANYKFIKNISEPIDDSMKLLLKNKKTVITLADALSNDLDGFIKNLSEMVNSGTNVIGCGTGFRNMKKLPSIFTPKGIFEDAALIIYSHEPMRLGLDHGWKKLKGPFSAHKIASNTLMEVNDEQKAFEVYQKILHDTHNVLIKEENFFEISKKFPLGIEKENQILMRDLIKKKGNGLYALGGFSFYNHIYIMEWDDEECKSAVDKSILEATAGLENNQRRFTFVFEGIGRRYYENNDDLINNDLSILKEKMKNIPQCGAVTLMEFSNKGSKEIQIHNNSVLLGVVY